MILEGEISEQKIPKGLLSVLVFFTKLFLTITVFFTEQRGQDSPL
jgi:hypothetical protein